MLLNVLVLLDPSSFRVGLLSHSRWLLLIHGLDFHHIDLLAHFGRERIPERVVRATLKRKAFTHSPDARFTPKVLVLTGILKQPTTSVTSPPANYSRMLARRFEQLSVSPRLAVKMVLPTLPAILVVLPSN